MTDRTIDQRCARAMGWTVKYDDERGCYSLCNPDGAAVISRFSFGDETVEQIEQDRWEVGTPHFSTNLAAAWTLVEYLRDKWTDATDVPWDAPNLPGSFRSFESPFDDGAFFDVLHRNADRRWPWAFLYVTPEAICVAFLAAVETTDGCI